MDRENAVHGVWRIGRYLYDRKMRAACTVPWKGAKGYHGYAMITCVEWCDIWATRTVSCADTAATADR